MFYWSQVAAAAILLDRLAAAVAQAGSVPKPYLSVSRLVLAVFTPSRLVGEGPLLAVPTRRSPMRLPLLVADEAAAPQRE